MQQRLNIIKKLNSVFIAYISGTLNKEMMFVLLFFVLRRKAGNIYIYMTLTGKE